MLEKFKKCNGNSFIKECKIDLCRTDSSWFSSNSEASELLENREENDNG